MPFESRFCLSWNPLLFFKQQEQRLKLLWLFEIDYGCLISIIREIRSLKWGLAVFPVGGGGAGDGFENAVE